MAKGQTRVLVWFGQQPRYGKPRQNTNRNIAKPEVGRDAVAALVSEVARQPLPVREAFAIGAEASSEILGQIFPPKGGKRAWGVFALMSGALALMRAIPDQDQRAEIREQVMTDLRSLATISQSSDVNFR